MKHTITKRKSWKECCAWRINLSSCAHTIQRALEHLKQGKPIHGRSVNMDEFMQIVDLPYWKSIEKIFERKGL